MLFFSLLVAHHQWEVMKIEAEKYALDETDGKDEASQAVFDELIKRRQVVDMFVNKIKNSASHLLESFDNKKADLMSCKYLILLSARRY